MAGAQLGAARIGIACSMLDDGLHAYSTPRPAPIEHIAGSAATVALSPHV